MDVYNFITRKHFIHTNKYQRKIIALVLIPSAIYCVSLTVTVLYLQRELINMILYATQPPSVSFVIQWGVVLLVGIWAVFIVAVAAAFFVSGDMVGAFGRIFRELDGMIQGGEKKTLRVRHNDELARELSERINVFINKLADADLKHDQQGKGRF